MKPESIKPGIPLHPQTPRTDSSATKWGKYRDGEFVPADFARTLETELAAAIASWDEERKRALREAARVQAWSELARDLGKILLEEYATPAHMRRVSNLLSRLDTLNGHPSPHVPCCSKERRNINGGCDNCGDPSL